MVVVMIEVVKVWEMVKLLALLVVVVAMRGR